VAFLRFSRDKRGYENIYLVETQNRRGKPSRQRVLYWYRTPPGIRVGRPPFDEEARRRIEAQNPGVVFDWPTIVATPIPPVTENEQWRERRRAERAAKQAQRAEEAAAVRAERETTAEPSEGAIEEDAVVAREDTPDESGSSETLMDVAILEAEPQPAVEEGFPTEIASGASEAVALQTTSERPQDMPMRKRRRRGGRRRRGRRQGDLPVGGPGGPASVAHGRPGETPDVPDPGSNEPSADFETGEFDPNKE
jgi:hypothetical protein